MRFLEVELTQHHKIRLAQRPAKLLKHFEDAGVGPVQVWNLRLTTKMMNATKR